MSLLLLKVTLDFFSFACLWGTEWCISMPCQCPTESISLSFDKQFYKLQFLMACSWLVACCCLLPVYVCSPAHICLFVVCLSGWVDLAPLSFSWFSLCSVPVLSLWRPSRSLLLGCFIITFIFSFHASSITISLFSFSYVVCFQCQIQKTEQAWPIRSKFCFPRLHLNSRNCCGHLHQKQLCDSLQHSFATSELWKWHWCRFFECCCKSWATLNLSEHGGHLFSHRY